jgi:Tol biopolymer transport system component
MKSKIAVYIICIISVTLLIYNQVLISEVKKERINNIRLKFEVIDLQTDYYLLHNENLRLQEENQLLGSYVAYSDTLY